MMVFTIVHLRAFCFGRLNYFHVFMLKNSSERSEKQDRSVGMSVTSTSTLDELRRVLLPSSLIQQMKWTVRTRLTALLVEKKQGILLMEQEGGEIPIDDLNRVGLSSEYCDALGWREKDVINVITSDSNTSSLLLTRLA